MTNDKELKISVENALATYNNTDANGRKLLENLFGKAPFEPKDIKERVKTFDDAVSVLGNDNQAVIDYYAIADATCADDILAFAKLRVIAEALNERGKPGFDDEEYRYYPWFYVYTKKEYEKLDDDEKKMCRVVGRAGGSVYRRLAYADANYASSYSNTDCGGRLAFKTRELAEYCGRQFIDIWERYLFA